MAAKKMKKKKNVETDEEVEVELTVRERLEELRRDVKSNDGLTALLDILIDNEGGDSAELCQTIADERAAIEEAEIEANRGLGGFGYGSGSYDSNLSNLSSRTNDANANAVTQQIDPEGRPLNPPHPIDPQGNPV